MLLVRVRIFVLAGMIVALTGGVIGGNSPYASAQIKPVTCKENTFVPSDGFESGGLGLTCVEWEELYGPGDLGQSSVYYDIEGVRVDRVRNGIVIEWSETNAELEIDETTALEYATIFFPADYQVLGNVGLGNTLHVDRSVYICYSETLAARFKALGEDYTGDFLVALTYTGSGMGDSGVSRLEIVPAGVSK